MPTFIEASAVCQAVGVQRPVYYGLIGGLIGYARGVWHFLGGGCEEQTLKKSFLARGNAMADQCDCSDGGLQCQPGNEHCGISCGAKMAATCGSWGQVTAVLAAEYHIVATAAEARKQG